MVFGFLSGGIRMKIDFVVVFGAIECEPRHPSNQRVVHRLRERFRGFLSYYLPNIEPGKAALDVYREVENSTNCLLEQTKMCLEVLRRVSVEFEIDKSRQGFAGQWLAAALG
jgi:hypothetical protein